MSCITGIFGKMGSGKTMLLTYFGKCDFENGFKIHSNYHLKNIPYTPIETLNDVNSIRDGTVLLDEMQLFVHARCSMSKFNQELLKIITMSRKRGLNLYYTSQLARTIDIILREVTDFYIYPVIMPFNAKDENGNIIKNMDDSDKIFFRLQYTVFNIYGQKVCTYTLVKPLEYLGSFFDTREEVKSLTKSDETPLQKGIKLEMNFSNALRKIKGVKHVEVLPNSGIHSSWRFDVVCYMKNKTLAFDVKGSCKERVYLGSYGLDLKKKISNALEHNAIPLLAFPNWERVQLTNPKCWYAYNLNQYSYLLGLSSEPSYNKLVRNSVNLVDFCINAVNPSLRDPLNI